MKKTTDSSLRNASQEWWNSLSIDERESLSDKHYIVESAAFLSESEIDYLYALQQETNPKAIIGSGVEDECSGEYFWCGNHLMRNDEVKFCSHHIMEINTQVINPSIEFLQHLADSLNNYQALRDSNAELLENIERIFDRIDESDLAKYFPSAYSRAKIAIQKAKSIK